MDNTEHRIALFLDFENLVTNTGISANSFDLQPAMDRLLERGKVVFRRAYCDWSRFKEAKGNLHGFGVELIDVPPSTRSGKNGADMRMVIDALELCYAREHIDTFAIASGDSDFCPLAYKLRENGRTLIGLGVKEATSPLFVKACDEFLYLRPRSAKEGGKEREREEKKDKRHEEGSGRGRGKHAKGQEAAERSGKESGHKGKAAEKAEVPEIAVEVVQRLLSRATGAVNPSLIKETIVRKEPDFDERDHGFSTFAKLLAAMEQDGLLKRVQQGRQWYVVGPEGGIEPPQSPGRGRNAPQEEEDEEEVYPDPVDE